MNRNATDHALLTDVQREIAAIQAIMTEQVAPNHAGDPLLAKFWHILNGLGEKVDTWLHREGGDHEPHK